MLPWDAAAAAFVPAADAMALTADVSYGAMWAALRPLLRAATAVRRLDDWVNACLGRAAAGGGGAGGGAAGAGAAEGVPVPLWLLRVAGYKGLRGAAAGRGAPAVRLVAGPTLTALHQVGAGVGVLDTCCVQRASTGIALVLLLLLLLLLPHRCMPSPQPVAQLQLRPERVTNPTSTSQPSSHTPLPRRQ